MFAAIRVGARIDLDDLKASKVLIIHSGEGFTPQVAIFFQGSDGLLHDHFLWHWDQLLHGNGLMSWVLLVDFRDFLVCCLNFLVALLGIFNLLCVLLDLLCQFDVLRLRHEGVIHFLALVVVLCLRLVVLFVSDEFQSVLKVPVFFVVRKELF